MLSQIKPWVWKKFVVPAMVRRGWRTSRFINTEDVYLETEFGYDEEDQIKRAVKIVNKNTMASFERLASLWQQVRYLDDNKIPGSFLECGVWKGGCMGLMALAHMSKNSTPKRELHLFDSFEGLPEPNSAHDGKKATEYSSHRDSGKLSAIGKCVGPLEENQRLFEEVIRYPKDLTHYHKGWVEDTLVDSTLNSMGPIALLRLDLDWYDPTKLALDKLYSKVSKGGVIVIDDYGHWEGCKKAVDEFLRKHSEPILLNHIDYTGRFWIKSN